MRIRAVFTLILVALVAIALDAQPSLADQTDPRLDRLFADLKGAEDAAAARPIEAEIWRIWNRSDNAEVNQLMAVGVARLNADDYARALELFDRVVRLAPSFAEGWNKRATTLFVMDRFAESKVDIERVLKLEPRHFGALSGLGLCEARLHKPKEALEAFRRAQALDPNLPSIAQNIDEMTKEVARQSI